MNTFLHGTVSPCGGRVTRMASFRPSIHQFRTSNSFQNDNFNQIIIDQNYEI